jgi:tetratricopeptide (TPR) repeat protein
MMAAVLGIGGVAARAEDPVLPEFEAPAPVEAVQPDPPAPVAAEPAPLALALGRLEEAWAEPAGDLAERAERTRAVADELHVASLDPLARAALFDSGSRASARERAEAAARLAPDLPLAHAARARAAWGGGSVLDALDAAGAAIVSLPRHLESWLWLGATASVLAMFAIAAGAVVFLLARGIATARFAAHDFGDLIEASTPAFARIAGLAAIALVPVAFGEGVAGLALGLFAIALCTPAREPRIAAGVAVVCLLAALYPLGEIAGARVAAVASADPVLLASRAAETGFVDPIDAARLARAGAKPLDADGDPIAVQALAQWQRRAGDLAAADARYAALLGRAETDPALLNNAAAVKLALADPASAIDLYRRALEAEPSALLWFNLSQAHGAAIDVEQHDRALAAAQAMDPQVVRDLTARLANARAAFAAELPLPAAQMRERLLAGDASQAARELRSALAPGWLGRSLGIALLAFVAVAFAVVIGTRNVEASSACLDCGSRLCRRCGTAPRGEGRCETCQNRRFQGRAAAAWDGARSGSLVERAGRLARRLLPGLAGGSRSALGLPAAIAGCAALAFAIGHDAVLPDPGSVGAAGSFALGAVSLVAGLLYLICVALHALRDRGSRA